MLQKLNELKNFIVVALLFAFRVLIRVLEAILDESYVVVLKLDTLINNEIVKVEKPASIQIATPIDVKPVDTATAITEAPPVV
jgi:hypothetical protein